MQCRACNKAMRSKTFKLVLFFVVAISLAWIAESTLALKVVAIRALELIGEVIVDRFFPINFHLEE